MLKIKFQVLCPQNETTVLNVNTSEADNKPRPHIVLPLNKGFLGAVAYDIQQATGV